MKGTSLVVGPIGKPFGLPLARRIDCGTEIPADGGVIVVGAGIQDAVPLAVIWQKAIVRLAVKGKQEDLHAWIAEVAA